MATLKNISSGEHTVLRAQHVIGRNRVDTHLYIGDTDISRHHAYLFWQDQVWLLRDVSSNGIWVSNQRINPAQAVVINLGDKIRFGSKNHNTWVLLDASAPQSSLIPISHDGPEIPLEPYNALPLEHPILEVIQKNSNRWFLHQDGQLTELNDGQLIEIQDETWQLHLVSNSACGQSTEKMPLIGLDCMQLQFRVSQDEEHVSLHAELDDRRQIDFGERTHHYLLLILARQRHQDWKQNFDEDAQGWQDMEALCSMLGMEASHVNIQIYRARKQFKKMFSSIADTGDFIERRVGSLRLRSRRFQIVRGSQLEASLSLQTNEPTVLNAND